MSRTGSVADLIKELKRSSSVWVKSEFPKAADFSWQSGYGVFSIGVSQQQAARAYIATEEDHHRSISFQDEFRRFLKKYEIDFDERYVWD